MSESGSGQLPRPDFQRRAGSGPFVSRRGRCGCGVAGGATEMVRIFINPAFCFRKSISDQKYV